VSEALPALHVPFGELLLRLLVAAVLGAALGWEREVRQKAAGLRTHMLVTLGAAVFTVLALEAVDTLAARYPASNLDPTRVIEGIVGGIGFLGAGAIIRSKGGVRGLTTAASVWICGAIGAASGFGAYGLAVLGAAFALVTIAGLGVLERRLEPRKRKDRTASGTA
jgi:putative Mg2+ transporter-C (MgtC) family protein